MSEELLQLNPEEIRQMGKILADILIQTPPQTTTEFTYVSRLEIETQNQTKVLVEAIVQACLRSTLDFTYVSEVKVQTQIPEVINLDLSASSVHGWTDILGQIADWFTSLLNAVASWIVSAIKSFIDSVAKGIKDAINWVLTTLSGAIDTVRKVILDNIAGAVKSIMDAISGVIKTVTDAISSIGKAILDAISGVVKTLSDAIGGLAKTLSDAIGAIAKSIIDAISGAIKAIVDAISGAFKAVSDALGAISKAILDAISGAIKAIVDAVGALAKGLSEAISSIGKAILDALTSAVKVISDALGTIAKAIVDAIGALAKAFSDALSTMGKAIFDAISGMVKAISDIFGAIGKAIMDAIGGFVKTVSDVFSAVGKAILDALSGAVKGIIDAIGTIAKGITDGIAGIGKGITSLWEFLVRAFQDIAAKVGAGFQVIGTTLMGFVNAVIQLPTLLAPSFALISDAIKGIVKALKDAFVEPIAYTTTAKGTIIVPPTVAQGLVFRMNWGVPIVGQIEGVLKPITDPLGWIKDVLVGAAKSLWDAITSGLSWLWTTIVNAVRGIAQSIINAFTGIAKFLSEVLTGFIQSIIGLFTVKGSLKLAPELQPLNDMWHDVYNVVEKETASVYSDIWIKPCSEAINIYKPPIKIDEVTKLTAGSLGFFAAVTTAPLWGSITARILAWVTRGLARWIYDMELPVRINLRPIGLGVDTTINVAKSAGGALYELADNLLKWVDEIGRGLVYGYTIWMSRPISRTFNWLIRNFVPVELPDIETMLEYTRRMLPHKNISDVMSLTKYYMALYGYSDYVLDLFLKPPKELSITVKDRFGADREIPLSLVYKLPSASDVATMMVRDIFATIDDFQRIYLATGMEKDVGVLYYFLRFRYPPPERLWQFTVRGISGLLWATLPDAEKADIRAEAERIGAPLPVAPETMNFKADQLLTAFKTYMKWHDYARFSWIKDFPSDNLIYIDTLADIPMKIDQRWMVKWGLYELLSAKQVTIQSPIRDFAAKILENTPTSEVKMDITNFSRTLLATGLHPDWVPITAVAEAMNALSEERTAIRTGFIGLFKEGFYNISALETLLSGFVTASFQVAYFSIADMKWTTGWVNLPIMYLPPERKLLELKALMDRSLDILREIQRDISTAYQEFIIWDYNEYKAKLTSVINNINTFYSSDYKAITGTELPKELRLQFVEEYYKPYVEALKIWRDVFTIRRVRMWTQRWLGWVMYRIAYGTAKKEDVEKLVTYVSEKAKLTDYETEFIQDVMNIMYGIARQSTAAEYLPTPSTLATLSEYIMLPSDLVKAVLSERGLSEQWMNIWLTYISVKPIKSDAKSLLSTYVRAFRYGAIPKNVLDDYIKTLPQYGFTVKEIEFITKSVDLEEQILEFRASRQEYIPTPSMLASMCEYVPEAREFFQQVMQARRVTPEWQKVWAKYIDVRPLVDDIKRYLSRAEALYVRFMTKKEDFQKILDEVTDYLGYTDKEIEFLMKVTEFERYRNAWTELIGSVERLVSLSEYSPKASEYALGKLYEMIDALPLPPTEKQKLKEMWEEYIRNRPVKSEAKTYITQLINMYVDGLITDAAFKKELQEMKKWGFSDNELMFYEAQAALRKARKLRIPIAE